MLAAKLSLLASALAGNLQVDITLVVTFYRNGRKTALNRTCRVRTVGRSRQQDDVAMSLPDAFQISPDYAQTCIFAGGSGIWLQRTAFESGNFAQVSR